METFYVSKTGSSYIQSKHIVDPFVYFFSSDYAEYAWKLPIPLD